MPPVIRIIDQASEIVASIGNFSGILSSSDSNVQAALETIDETSAGWLNANETWTYASADDPTFTFTITGDKTSKYSAGMKIKLTQTTAKYFIITKVVYTSNTTITVYGGTDYNLVSAAITSPYYSTQKAPHGFPLNPEKWTVEASLTSDATQLEPTYATWYNLGAFSLSVPIGAWRIDYQVTTRIEKANSTSLFMKVSLSKENDTYDDAELTSMGYTSVITYCTVLYSFLTRSKYITTTAKTPYYLMALSGTTATVVSIMFRGGSTYGDATIRATCAYL